MKTDAIVLGAELDAWVAALRLRELGHSVKLLTSGAGSLHYASGGVHPPSTRMRYHDRGGGPSGPDRHDNETPALCIGPASFRVRWGSVRRGFEHGAEDFEALKICVG